MTLSTVTVQTTPESLPTTPSWMGEVAAVAQILSQTGILTSIEKRVRFARARMGTYELIDFVVVLIGYVLSAEPTLRAFYDRLLPFADPFMALFGRNRLPSRSALSRYLAALDQASVESLRTLFQADLLARIPFASPGGIRDRCGQSWLVADVDGTRKAARQRALPQAESLPVPHRRFDQVCAKGYQGRKRGEVVRTRTVVLQAHTHQFLGTFGEAGNGNYRGELLRAIQALLSYGKQVLIPAENVVIRLDGLYGNAAPLTDVLTSGLGLIARSKDYHLLDLAQVQAVLAGPPAPTCTHPESQTTRVLFDCPAVPLSPAGPLVRCSWQPVLRRLKPPRSGSNAQRWSTNSSSRPCPLLPSARKMCWICICIAARLRRCWPMKMLSRDADRWVSHTACGQEFFQILAQWLWNLRLELGQHLAPAVMRTTEFAPAHVASPVSASEPVSASKPTPTVVYGPPQWAKRSFTGGFPGSAFPLQPDGTLCCPADKPLYAQERRPEHDGSLRVLYAGRIGFCRSCPLRQQCQEHPSAKKPRRVSAVFWPLPADPLAAPALPSELLPLPLPSSAPLLWRDWPRRSLRRHWLQLIRRETVTFSWEPFPPPRLPELPIEQGEIVSTREQRAHYRLSWPQRLDRNARPADAPRLLVLLHGLPARFFETFGSPAQAVA